MGVLTNDVEFESIQTISTLNDYHAKYSAATSIEISYDHNYIVAANAGDNSVTVYRIDTNTGLLEKLFCLPISGDDPKDAVLFPDNKHLVSLNHESGTLTFFEVDIEKRQLIMCAKELKVASPNCIVFKAVEE